MNLPPYYDPEGNVVSIRLLTDLGDSISFNGRAGFIFAPEVTSSDILEGTISYEISDGIYTATSSFDYKFLPLPPLPDSLKDLLASLTNLGPPVFTE